MKQVAQMQCIRRTSYLCMKCAQVIVARSIENFTTKEYKDLNMYAVRIQFDWTE